VRVEPASVKLCDIGNTTFDFYEDGFRTKKSLASYIIEKSQEKIYYICVNERTAKELKNYDNWIDLEPFVDRNKYYDTMGIDRIAACEAVENGVIVDAGSAITVDVVQKGVFQGGYIALGLQASQKAYEEISPRLAYSYNFEIDLDTMPKNSQDAITYAQFGLLCRDVMHRSLPVYLTGGDAHKLKALCKGAEVDETLVFQGMKKIIQKAGLC
jgi:type III pantothenate kinase